MSFQFSSDNSRLSLKSDYISESSLRSYSKTLGMTGANILSSSFPQISKKVDIKKENETYAYLEKLKHLDISTNKIEHIHFLPRFDRDDYSFKNLDHRSAAPAIWTSDTKSSPERPEFDKVARFMDPAKPPEALFQSQIKFMTADESIDRYGILLPCNLVLTVPSLNKNTLKSFRLKSFQNQTVTINKVGALVQDRDFAVVTVDDCGLEPGNVRCAFKLNKMDRVHVLGYDTRYHMNVVDITYSCFAFTYVGYTNFIRGAQVYSTKWELQGIYSHSILDLHFVLRFEPILSSLLRNREEIDRPEVEKMLSPYSMYT